MESKHKLKKQKKKRKDPRIQSEEMEEVEITDPVTGEKSIQLVKVVRYKPITAKPVGNKGLQDEEVELEEIDYTWDED